MLEVSTLGTRSAAMFWQAGNTHLGQVKVEHGASEQVDGERSGHQGSDEEDKD